MLDELSLGTKIRRFRKMRGFTQGYMADKMDLSIRGYSKIELGETKLSVIRLFEIAEILDLSVHEILLPAREDTERKSGSLSARSQRQLLELQDLLERILDRP